MTAKRKKTIKERDWQAAWAPIANARQNGNQRLADQLMEEEIAKGRK
jgi:hypothetical protein